MKLACTASELHVFVFDTASSRRGELKMMLQLKHEVSLIDLLFT